MQEDAHTRGVNQPRRGSLWLLVAVGAVVLADEMIKFRGLTAFPAEGTVANPGLFSLAIHKNWGIAFDIPFKMSFVILISLAIGAALLYVARRNVHRNPPVALASLMIVFGALGNMYDRLAYGFTVDYMVFFGRSAVNLSDAVIVAGVVLLLYASRVRDRREDPIDGEEES